jgi:amino acid efflux transporter
VVAALVLVYLAALVLNGLELTAFILIHTSCMAAVYAAGMLAALRLLARYSLGWWLALISCVLVAGLLLLAGVHLLVPAVLAVAAVVVGAVRRRRTKIGRARSGVLVTHEPS